MKVLIEFYGFLVVEVDHENTKIYPFLATIVWHLKKLLTNFSMCVFGK